MLLKDHLKEVYKNASHENNTLIKENIVNKWVHRFGVDSLSDLLIQASDVRERNYEQENPEQIKLKLLETVDNPEETNYELNDLETVDNPEENNCELNDLETLDNPEENNCELNDLEVFSTTEKINNEKISDNNANNYSNYQKLPLPYIKNLRKWINNDRKAS